VPRAARSVRLPGSPGSRGSSARCRRRRRACLALEKCGAASRASDERPLIASLALRTKYCAYRVLFSFATASLPSAPRRVSRSTSRRAEAEHGIWRRQDASGPKGEHWTVGATPDNPASELLQDAVRAEVRRRQLLAAGDKYVEELIAEVGKRPLDSAPLLLSSSRNSSQGPVARPDSCRAGSRFRRRQRRLGRHDQVSYLLPSFARSVTLRAPVHLTDSKNGTNMNSLGACSKACFFATTSPPLVATTSHAVKPSVSCLQATCARNCLFAL